MADGDHFIPGIGWKISTVSGLRKRKFLKNQGWVDELEASFFTEPNWEIVELIVVKYNLAQLKAQIGNQDPQLWQAHTNIMSPTKLVVPYLRQQFKIEASRAWCKMMECLTTHHHLIPESQGDRKAVDFHTVHLCEGSGHFVQSMNHYLKTSAENVKWDWLATSLNPYYEGNFFGSMAEDDKLIRACYKSWTFLADNTGDIMNQKNIESLTHRVKKKVHLVTANGSVGNPDKSNDQRERQDQLQLAEIVAAINILQHGGSFLLRIFNYLECTTISQLYLLSCLFTDVTLFKPASSNAGSSELYVLCTGFIKTSKNFKKLTYYVGPRAPSCLNARLALLPRKVIPNEFIEKLKLILHYFADLQLNAIRKSLETFQLNRYLYGSLLGDQYSMIAKKWIQQCQIKHLDKSLRLFPEAFEQDERALEYNFEFTRYTNENQAVTLKNVIVWVDEKLAPYADFLARPRMAFTIDEPYKIISMLFGKSYVDVRSSPYFTPRISLSKQQLKDMFGKSNLPLSKMDSGKHCSEAGNIAKLQTIVTELQGMKLWRLKNICFHETVEDFVHGTDAERAQSGINKLVQSLRKMRKGKSLFLCEYPLLTRLHVGLIFGIASLFENHAIFYDNDKKIQGVFLHRFKDHKICPAGLPVMLNKISAALRNTKVPNMMLEVTLKPDLVNSKFTTQLKEYNLVNEARKMTDSARRISHAHRLVKKRGSSNESPL